MIPWARPLCVDCLPRGFTRSDPAAEDAIDDSRGRSRRRARGEHGWHVVKRLWGFLTVRARGSAKNLARAQLMFGLANLYLLRRRVLPTGVTPCLTCAPPHGPPSRPTRRDAHAKPTVAFPLDSSRLPRRDRRGIDSFRREPTRCRASLAVDVSPVADANDQDSQDRVGNRALHAVVVWRMRYSSAPVSFSTPTGRRFAASAAIRFASWRLSLSGQRSSSFAADDLIRTL